MNECRHTRPNSRALLRCAVTRSRHAWTVTSSIRPSRWLPPTSAFAGFRFPAEVTVVAVRWYPRYNLSYRDIEELLVEHGVRVDHVTSTGGSSGSLRCWLEPFTAHHGHLITRLLKIGVRSSSSWRQAWIQRSMMEFGRGIRTPLSTT